MPNSHRPVVVVMEGVSAGRYFADAAMKQGFDPVVVFPNASCSEPYRVMRDSAAGYWKAKGCRVIEPKEMDRASMLEVVRALEPAAVVSGSELGVPWTDFLTRSLGLAGNDPATSIVRRNKFEMQKRLEEAGVAALKCRKCKTPEECVEAASSWNTWPVVVKPLAGAGSLGVHFCENAESLKEVCRALFREQDLFGTPNSEVLLQEFARGTEFIVNTMSCRGRHMVTDIWRYDKIAVGSKGNAYNYAALVRTPNETEKSLAAYTLEVLDALGFEYGPSHTELMLTARGPRLIETAARPMGGFFPPDLMRGIFGFDHAELSLACLLDIEKFESFAAKPYAPAMSALLKIVVSKSSRPVEKLYYENIVAEAPVVKRWEFDLVKRTGSVLETVDLETAAGEVFAASANPEAVWLAYESMRRLELECEGWLFSQDEKTMTTPIMHAVGDVPFTEHLCMPWSDVIRHAASFSRNAPSATSLMIETDTLSYEEATVFASLLGLFGWKQIEYGSFLKL